MIVALHSDSEQLSVACCLLTMMLVSLLPLLLLAAPLTAGPAPLPVGPDLTSNTAAVAIAGLAVAAKLSEDECDDVGVRMRHLILFFFMI